MNLTVKWFVVSIGEAKIVLTLIHFHQMCHSLAGFLILAVGSATLCGDQRLPSLVLVTLGTASVRTRLKNTHFKARNPTMHLHIHSSAVTSSPDLVEFPDFCTHRISQPFCLHRASIGPSDNQLVPLM